MDNNPLTPAQLQSRSQNAGTPTAPNNGGLLTPAQLASYSSKTASTSNVNTSWDAFDKMVADDKQQKLATPQYFTDFGPMGRELGSEASAGWNAVKTGAKGIADYVGSYGQNVAKNFMDSVNGVKSSIQDTGADSKQAGQDLKNGHVLSGIGNFIKGQARGDLGSVSNGLGALFSPISSLIETTGQKMGEALTAPGSVVDANSPEVQKFAQDHGLAIDKINSFVDSTKALLAKYPQATKIVNDAINTALMGIGGEQIKGEIPDVPSRFSDAIDTLKNSVNKLPDTQGFQSGPDTLSEAMGKGTVEKIPGQESNADFNQRITDAQKIQNPYGKYNPTKNQSLYGSGEIQGKGSGIFAKDVQAPKPNLQDEQVANLIDEGKISPKNLPSKNIEAIKQEVRATDSNIDTFIQKPELNQPFNQTAVDKTASGIVQKAKDSNLFLADSSEQKAYEQIGDIFKKNIADQPYNSAGLRNGIKAANEEVARVLDTDIYKDVEGQPTSISKARIKAAQDFRAGYNDMLANNLDRAETIGRMKVLRPSQAEPLITKAENFPKKQDFINYAKNNMDEFPDSDLASGSQRKVQGKQNTSNQYVTSRDGDLGELWDIAHTESNPQSGSIYKQNLQKEAQLLNAADDIGFNARSGVGKSKLQLFVKQHPWITGVAGGASVGEILRRFLGI